MQKRLVTLALLTALCAASEATAQAAITGFGVLGDSGSDEYRADDSRGGAYAATTFNWLELWAQYRGMNVGAWGTRAYPRRTGYAYNWALSGARAADVVAGGQAAGLAGQVASGLVSHAYLLVGENDFASWNGTYAEIYNGSLSDSQVAAKVSALVASVADALDTVQAAGPVTMLVATIADRGPTAGFMALYPNAAGRQRVTNAILSTNDGIRNVAGARGATVVDMYSLGATLLPQVDQYGNLHVGSESISLVVDGDEPHHVLLGDHEHAGTVFEGVLSNFIADGLVAAGAAAPTHFSDTELLNHAGIYPSSAFAPGSYTILQGTKLSGTLASLAADDGNYLTVRSTTSGSIRVSETEVTFSGVTASSTQLTLNVRCKSSTSQTSIGIALYNVTTGVWTDYLATTFPITTSEANYAGVFSNASSYISAAGDVRARVISGRYTTTYTLSLEKMSLVAQ